MPDNILKRPSVDPAQIETLTDICIDDLLDALGLSGFRRSRRPLELLFRIPGRRLARQIATYDKIVGEFELRAGGEWALGRMTQRLKDDGFDVNPPKKLHGGWTFYFRAPGGGFLIEVLHQPEVPY